MVKLSFDQYTLHQFKYRLQSAIQNNRSAGWCLRLWSRFIKARDDHRCVCCEGHSNLQAHHVIRKCLYPWGAFELGNGITLCDGCHRKIHAEFNGRPAFDKPFGAEGGDDQDEWAFLFGLLYEDAKRRGLDQDQFYFIETHMLEFFVRHQGYEHLYESVMRGNISRIRFAHEIWRVMPELWYTNFVTRLIQVNL